MGQSWYYTQGGQQVGPVEWGQLQQMAAMGRLGPSDMVWSDGMAQWAAAATVPGLMPGAPAAPYGATPGAYGGAPAGYGAPLSNATPLQYGGFWLRFVALIIDGLIVGIPLRIIGAVVGIPLILTPADITPQRLSSMMASLMMFGLFEVVAVWLYHALLESSSYQASVGKMALGLKVTDLNGGRISFLNATGRYFAKIISALPCYIGFMMAGWTQQKQAHDMIAGTLVVKK